MPEFLTAAFAEGPAVSPWFILERLLLALVFGFLVAWIHRWTRRADVANPTFFATLVLLCVLIAMVTQVIGDNVARAFSLVGALSIVRFRTVLRDTQDTAYVIFAVVVGMAVGARNPWAALIGIAVVTLAAVLLMPKSKATDSMPLEFELRLRAGLGYDMDAILAEAFRTYVQNHTLTSIGTARQGTSLEAAYRVNLRPEVSAVELVRLLNQTEGVQDVQLQRCGVEDI